VLYNYIEYKQIKIGIIVSITKFISILISITLIHSCSMDLRSRSLKRSANDKLMDSVGARSDKRRPIENNEYIRKAKMNIENQEADDEDEDEDNEDTKYNLNSRYKKMYEDMLYKDKKRKNQRILKGSGSQKIFDNYKRPQMQNPRANNEQNISRSSDQDKILKEIEALRRRIESLSAKDCTLNNNSNKDLQDYLDKTTSNDNNRIIEKTLPSKPSIEEGGSCLLPE